MEPDLFAWESPLTQAFVAAFLTMMATGLGALPVLFTRHLPKALLGGGYALAGGMMLSVSKLVCAGSYGSFSDRTDRLLS